MSEKQALMEVRALVFMQNTEKIERLCLLWKSDIGPADLFGDARCAFLELEPLENEGLDDQIERAIRAGWKNGSHRRTGGKCRYFSIDSEIMAKDIEYVLRRHFVPALEELEDKIFLSQIHDQGSEKIKEIMDHVLKKKSFECIEETAKVSTRTALRMMAGLVR